MKRLKRPNSLFLQGEVSSAVLKTWKTRETKTRITQNFQILYHIQGTTMRMLTSWGFRKCGSFGPGEFLKRSYWLSKSSNFSNFFESKMRCQKKRHGHNFDFSGLPRNQRGTNPIGKPLIPCQTRKIKIVAVTFFCYASSDPIFFLKFDLTLTANNSPLKSRTPQKYHIFGKLRTSAFSWCPPGYGIVFENFE